MSWANYSCMQMLSLLPLKTLRMVNEFEIITVYDSKRHRGLMARWIIPNKVKSTLRNFQSLISTDIIILKKTHHDSKFTNQSFFENKLDLFSFEKIF